MRDKTDRRTFVRGVGALTVAGTLAGCSGGDEGGESGGDDGGDESGDGGGDGEEEAEETLTVPSAVSDYLSETDNFEGDIVDETGSDSVTVTVGVEANGGQFGFGPAAVAVSTGTTVTWEWNGQGGQHNVVAEEGADFESEQTDEEGFTFEQTFEETGTVTYYCSPHESLGMKGAVVVTE